MSITSMTMFEENVEALFKEKEEVILCYLPKETGPSDFFALPQDEKDLIQKLHKARNEDKQEERNETTLKQESMGKSKTNGARIQKIPRVVVVLQHHPLVSRPTVVMSGRRLNRKNTWIGAPRRIQMQERGLPDSGLALLKYRKARE